MHKTDLSANLLTMMITGELMLGIPENPESFFDLVAPVLGTADLVIGHLETPHTNRPQPSGVIMLPAPAPDNMRGLTAASFSAVTLAGNPTYSYGSTGIEDTIEWLQNNGIAHVGAGMNIDEAKRPIVLERNGTRFGYLSYDCIGNKANAANYNKPGCAYVDIITHYEPSRFPGGVPQIYTWAEPASLAAMCEDIRSLRSQCDVLSVVLHMGLGMTEIVLAEYETQVAHAAIDAGADLIIGNHCHVLKGIDFYKGKAIFHCLGNLVTVFPWEEHRMFQQEPETTLTKSRIRGRAGHGRSWMDPEYPCYPFPPSSRKAIIAKFTVENGAIIRISYLPCLINKQGQPEILKHDERGQEVFDYMEMITGKAGLNAHYEWDGDEVIIHT